MAIGEAAQSPWGRRAAAEINKKAAGQQDAPGGQELTRYRPPLSGLAATIGGNRSETEAKCPQDDGRGFGNYDVEMRRI